MKWRIYRESNGEADIKKLLKMNGVTKLPSGVKISHDRIEWRKNGGYAGGKTLGKMRTILEGAGWKKGKWKPSSSPDGSWTSNSDNYTSPDGKIVMSYYSHYGSTASDNSYGFTFKLAESTMNESYGNGDWDSGKPLVRKYHSEEKISVEEFVDKVRFWEQNIEDMLIQNSDYYENADDPLNEFLGDMCQGQLPEDVFDLGYYMNQAAKEQLPYDIAKYVRLAGFDAMGWLRGIFERIMPICKDPR